MDAADGVDAVDILPVDGSVAWQGRLALAKVEDGLATHGQDARAMETVSSRRLFGHFSGEIILRFPVSDTTMRE